MAFSPIAFVSPNYRDFKTHWVKPYIPGGTTPKVFALESDGGTQVAKLEINADGFLISAGEALVIPYIDGAYDLWMFPSEAEADANDTSNALKIADDITGVSQATLDSDLINDLSQAYEFATVAEYKAFTTAFPVGKVINLLDREAEFLIISGTGTGNNLDIIASDQVSQSVDLVKISPVNIRAYGCVLDGVTDDHTAYQACMDDNDSIFHPKGTAAVSDELVYNASRTTVTGESKDVSFTKWIGLADPLKSVYRLCADAVGTDPLTSKLQNSSLQGITIQCDNKAGYGWYVAHANTITITDVEVTRALRFAYFALRVFTSAFTRVGAFACGDGCAVLGFNLYGWSGVSPSEYTINAVNMYNITGTSCGFNQTFDPTVDFKLGAGFLFGEGISNNVFGLTVQESTGAGIVTTGNGGVNIYGVYAEKNGDYMSEFYHIYNDGITNFQNLNMIFAAENIAYANVRMHVDGFNAVSIKGPGEVTMTGEFANAVVETRRLASRVVAKHDDYDPANRTRKAIMFGNNSSFASENFRGARTDKWKAYVIFNGAVTIPASQVLEIMEGSTGGDKIGESDVIPAGSYVADDFLIVDMPGIDISPFKTGWIRLQIAYAGANHEIGIFAEEYI